MPHSLTVTSRLLLITLALGLGACAAQRPAPQPQAPLPPLQTLPPTAPSPKAPASKPATPAARPAPRTSASFAPPPSGPSHWDQGLGVYVLDNQPGVYYRQRTYYRWSNGWGWATNPNGPWEATDSSGVPPGLGRQHP